MAASIVRGHGKLLQHICRKCNLSKHVKKPYSTSFYVLLPEVPPDTPETNPLLRRTKLPEFSKITPENIITGGAKSSIEFETKLSDHITQLADVHYPKTFDSVLKPIEEITVQLNYVWRTARNLGYVKDAKFKVAFQRTSRQITEAKLERWLNETLYNAVKEVAANRANLDEYQQRLVDHYLFLSKLYGIEFKGEDKTFYIALMNKVCKDTDTFRDNVILCQGLFNHPIEDMKILEKLPNSLLLMLANYGNVKQGPWKVHLYEPLYSEFMSHCADRTTRWNVWQARSNLASHTYASQHLNNNVLINEIRAYRGDVAKRHGHVNYAEYAVSRNMARTIENVVNFLESIKTAVLPKATEELEALEKFAQDLDGLEELKNWDWLYYKTLKAKQICGLNAEGVSEYFPLPTVMEGLFNLCSKLFGINFKENKECDVWDEHVKAFDVLEKDGTYISTFYIDPYVRTMKRIGFWMEPGEVRSEVVGRKPFSYLGLCLTPSSSSSAPPLLTFDEVHKLVQAFGNGLQQMLSTSPYSEISGQLLLELDALDICSRFMEFWLTKPEVVVSLSSHHITGKPLTEDLASKIIQGHRVLDTFFLMEEVFKSAFDLEVHIQKWSKGWHTIMTKTYASYMPCSLDEWYYEPNSFIDMFSGQYGGCYYSFIWSKMVAADVFAAFEDEETDKVEALGKRFRDTFLAYGGSIPASEVFRRFRGRDPSIEAMLDYYV